MIIHPPQRTDGDKVRISAKVEMKRMDVSVPKELWFQIPQEYAHDVTTLADAFVVALLPTAMFLGEDIEVRSFLSTRLTYGLQEFQNIITSWWPTLCKQVKIVADGHESRQGLPNKGATGCSFSGGVDSMYSLWQHLKGQENIPSYRITHGLMINGFDNDVDLEDTGYFRGLLSVYRPMLESLGIELVTIRHNLQQFRFHKAIHRRISSTYSIPLKVIQTLLSSP